MLRVMCRCCGEQGTERDDLFETLFGDIKPLEPPEEERAQGATVDHEFESEMENPLAELMNEL